MSMTTCPSLDELLRLDSERIGDVTFAGLEEHLERCDRCRAALEARVAGLPWAGRTDPEGPTPAPLSAPPGYEIGRELGRGGMGVVHLATRQEDGLPVALKFLGGGPDERARWRREAEAMRRLDHPGVVRLLELAELGPWTCLVLEHVPGGRLEDRLDGSPSPREAAELVEAVARAIQGVHDAGLLHLDLKPSNILLDAGPDAPLGRSRPQVADFGLALPWGDPEATWTMAAGPRGTPSYMAPEQLSPTRAGVGPAADVYALGAILYRILAGRPPVLAGSRLESYLQLRDREPVPPRRLNPEVPRSLETICLACLRKDPRRRYGSARGLAEDLRRFLDGERIRQKPDPVPVRVRRWCRRHPGQAAMGLAVASALVALVLVQTSRLRAEQAERARVERELAEQGEDLAAFSGLLGSHQYLAYAALFDIGEADLASVLDNLEPLRDRLRGKRRDGTIDVANLALLGQLESLTGQMLVVEGQRLSDADEALDEAVSALGEAIDRAPGLALSRRFLVESLCVDAFIDTMVGRSDRALGSLSRAREVALGGPGRAIDPFLLQTISIHRLQVAGRLRSQGEHERADGCLRANLGLIEGEDAEGIDEHWLQVHRAITRFGLGESLAVEPPGPGPLWSPAYLQDAWTNLLTARLMRLTVEPAGPGAIEDFIAQVEAHEAMLGLEVGSSVPKVLGNVAFRIASAERSPAELAVDGPAAGRLLGFVRRLADRHPDRLAYVEPLHSAFGYLGTTLRASGHLDGAERLAEEFLRLARDLSERHPDRAEGASLLAAAFEQVAKNAWRHDDIAGVASWTRRSIDAMRRAVELDPSNELYRGWLLERERRLAALPPH